MDLLGRWVPEESRDTPRLWHAPQDEIGTIPPPRGFFSWRDYYQSLDLGGGAVLYETTVRGEKATLVWTRAGEDVATCGLHFVGDDSGSVVDFTPENRTTVKDNLLIVWGLLKVYYDPSVALDRIIFHRFGVGIRRPNPASSEWAVAPAVAGTGDADAELPPQVATSVTFKTARRRNWGRVYLPATVASTIDAGRFDSGYIGNVRTYWGAFLEAMHDANLPLVVWSPRHGGEALSYGDGTPAGRAAAHEAGLDNPDSSSFARSVDQVQVDDVADVIRSRRYSKALVKDTHTLGA